MSRLYSLSQTLRTTELTATVETLWVANVYDPKILRNNLVVSIPKIEEHLEMCLSAAMVKNHYTVIR